MCYDSKLLPRRWSTVLRYADAFQRRLDEDSFVHLGTDLVIVLSLLFEVYMSRVAFHGCRDERSLATLWHGASHNVVGFDSGGNMYAVGGVTNSCELNAATLWLSLSGGSLLAVTALVHFLFGG